jgi:parallel beta-helix repeat protein
MAQLRIPTLARTRLLGGVILALAALGVLVLGGGQAHASHVYCGETITTDTTLDSDLIDCPNNGIIIGADDITLDLNDHTIDSDGTPAAGCDPETEVCDVGVFNDGHDGVTISQGSVRQFDAGVIVGEARRNRLLGLSSSSSRFIGIIVFDSARSALRGSTVARNGLHTDQAGIVLFHSQHVRIIHNSIRNNGDIGLFMPRSDQNQIRGNRVRNHPEAGVNDEGGDGNRISHNLLNRDGDGIVIGGNRNAVIRNSIFHSRAGPQSGGNGIHAAAGHDNLIAGNIVGRAAIGIRVSLLPGEIGGGTPAVDTVLRGNRLRRSGEDGVFEYATARRTLLRGNRAARSGDDGFDIDSHATKLRRNRAWHNHDLGIEAVPGVIDGGGNVAHHNGDPRQCTNILCS